MVLIPVPVPSNPLSECRKLPAYLPHHCFSHGMPLPSPSILTPGHFRRKNLASAHEVIWEQWMRPSHLNGSARAGGQQRDRRVRTPLGGRVD